MTFFQDLAPCDYFSFLGDPSCLRAVGWLEAEEEHATGDMNSVAFERLCEFLVDPYEVGSFAGYHDCGLCGFNGLREVRSYAGHQLSLGVDNLFVPWNEERALFAAPSLVVHYIAEHSYLPPAPFVSALLSCPAMGSPGYVLSMLENGPKTELWEDGAAWWIARRVSSGHVFENCVDLVPVLLRVLERANRTAENSFTSRCAAQALGAIGIPAKVAIPEIQRGRDRFFDEIKAVETFEDAIKEIREA